MRKGLWYILVLVVLAGCTSREIDSRLAQVNGLANSNMADSAMLLLGEIDKPSLNEYNSRYHDLMTIKTRDKADLDIINDTLITEIIQYFVDNGTDDVKGEAYYYGGRVYREIGDAPQALDYFQKALDVLDDTHTRLKGNISSQMGQLFFDLNLYEQAKSRFQEAVTFKTLLNDSVSLMLDYRELGMLYKNLNHADSARFYYNRALDIAQKLYTTSKYEQDIRYNIIDFYIKIGQNDSALKEYASLSDVYRTLNADYTYCTAININILNKNYNKVEQLAKKLVQSKSIQSRWFAYGILKDLAKYNGNATELYDYLIRYEECMDSINRMTSRETVAYKDAFYNYSLREKENTRLKDYQQELHTIILYIVLFCMALLFFGVKKSLDNKALKLERLILLDKLDRINEKDSYENMYEEHENDSPEQLLEQIKEQIKEITQNINPDTYRFSGSIIQSDVYHKFKSFANDGYPRISDEDWKCLDEIVNTAHKNFSKKIHILYNKLKLQKYRTIVLVKCGFTNKEMASILCLSEAGIHSIQKRLYENLFFEKGNAKDFKKIILSL